MTEDSHLYLPWYAKLMFLALYAAMGFVINHGQYDQTFWCCLGMGLVAAFAVTLYLPRWIEAKYAEFEALLK